ncbi:MAG: DUF2721 domain-containing protein [Anaerolineales bacterium]|nr:DUF2721 domain-containing protein [Anaerolineales bacterium]
MDFTLTTPALLFSAISLLFLSYNTRFLALASLIRELITRYKDGPDPRLKGQLKNLRFRIVIIRYMQIFGVLAFFGCVLCMFLLFFGLTALGEIIFGASLVLLLVSLGLSLLELSVSIDALQLQIEEIDDL